MQDHAKQPAGSSAPEHGAHATDTSAAGKSTLAHAASDSNGGSVPDLAATAQLSKPLGTYYFSGQGGTVIVCSLSGRIFGNSHTNGSASISGIVGSSNGKPDANVAFQYNHMPFNISLVDDPINGHKLNAQLGFTGSGEYLTYKTTIISKGDSLTIRLDGYVKVPGPHHSYTTVGVGVYVDISVAKRPPRGAQPEPEPVTIPVKVIVPTLVAAAGVGLVGILEGIGIVALAA
jgi:hypothetical protein